MGPLVGTTRMEREEVRCALCHRLSQDGMRSVSCPLPYLYNLLLLLFYVASSFLICFIISVISQRVLLNVIYSLLPTACERVWFGCADVLARACVRFQPPALVDFVTLAEWVRAPLACVKISCFLIPVEILCAKVIVFSRYFQATFSG